jgi:C-terminal processing protease CtpA/Prc
MRDGAGIANREGIIRSIASILLCIVVALAIALLFQREAILSLRSENHELKAQMRGLKDAEAEHSKVRVVLDTLGRSQAINEQERIALQRELETLRDSANEWKTVVDDWVQAHDRKTAELRELEKKYYELLERTGAKPLTGGWIGANLRNSVDEDLHQGAIVERTVPGAPAARGLRAGDVILGINGTEITTAVDVLRILGQTPVGQPLQFRIVRGTNFQYATVTPAAWPR